jgi:hypothetical protein
MAETTHECEKASQVAAYPRGRDPLATLPDEGHSLNLARRCHASPLET